MSGNDSSVRNIFLDLVKTNVVKSRKKTFSKSNKFGSALSIFNTDPHDTACKKTMTHNNWTAQVSYCGIKKSVNVFEF